MADAVPVTEPSESIFLASGSKQNVRRRRGRRRRRHTVDINVVSPLETLDGKRKGFLSVIFILQILAAIVMIVVSSVIFLEGYSAQRGFEWKASKYKSWSLPTSDGKFVEVYPKIHKYIYSVSLLL